MTPLKQRFIEDMQMRGLAPTTQRQNYFYGRFWRLNHRLAGSAEFAASDGQEYRAIGSDPKAK